MFLAKVIGNAVSTQKDRRLVGSKLLLIIPIDNRQEYETAVSGPLEKNMLVAVDMVGAGVGEIVIATSGTPAVHATEVADSPVDCAIIGIIDTVDIVTDI